MSNTLRDKCNCFGDRCDYCINFFIKHQNILDKISTSPGLESSMQIKALDRIYSRSNPLSAQEDDSNDNDLIIVTMGIMDKENIGIKLDACKNILAAAARIALNTKIDIESLTMETVPEICARLDMIIEKLREPV